MRAGGVLHRPCVSDHAAAGHRGAVQLPPEPLPAWAAALVRARRQQGGKHAMGLMSVRVCVHPGCC